MARSITGRRAGEPERPLLDELAEAYDAGDLQKVLATSSQVLERTPGCVEALHYQAVAQLELGDYEAADATFRKALKVAPDDPELLLAAADLLICHPGEDRQLVELGLSHLARARKLARKRGDPALTFEILLLEGIGWNQLGECESALERLDQALELEPASTEAVLERAIALFELCRFEAAERAFLELVEAAPDEPWAHHYLGLLAERRKDLREAKRRFTRARALAPTEFPPPQRLSEEEFDRALEDAVARLPEHVKKYLENTTISVEDLPDEEDLIASKPPLSPSILGVFRGTPVGERSITSSHDHFPASIVLYQRNLERFARSREELIEQIGITLMHEVGHLLGLDEDDLWERGLE